jgi:hypothetical protein
VNQKVRDRIALALMLVTALGAFFGFVASFGTVSQARAATHQVEAWRMIGFLMFSAVFVLLGVWPRRYPLLWELTILNKLAITVIQLLVIPRAVNALTDGAIDAVVTALLLVAYGLARGYEPTLQLLRGGRSPA